MAPPRPTPRVNLISRSEANEAGALKWFDPAKGIGFIRSDAGPDVFVHQSTVLRYGIDLDLLANSSGQRLVFKTNPGVINDTPVVSALFIE